MADWICAPLSFILVISLLVGFLEPCLENSQNDLGVHPKAQYLSQKALLSAFLGLSHLLFESVRRPHRPL